MINKVEYDQMQFVWVSNFWDFPLKGICMWGGKLHEFAGWDEWFKIDNPTEDEDDWDRKVFFNLTPLTFTQRLKWRFRQRMFELCVGTHWTYKNNQRGLQFHWRKPVWLHKLLCSWYYKTKGFK